MLMSTISGDTSFDVFGLDHYKSTIDNDDYIDPPYGNYFLTSVIIVVVLLIVVKFVFFLSNNFTLNIKMAYVLVSIYGGFLAISLVFGILSRKS